MRYAILFPALGAAMTVAAGVVPVNEFDYYGPYPVSAPLMIDSLDVNSKPYGISSLLNQPIEVNAQSPSGARRSGPLAPGYDAGAAMHMLAFTVDAKGYAAPKLKVSGLKDYKVMVDGKAVEGDLRLTPSSHRVVIKYVSDPSRTDSLNVTLEGADNLKISSGEKRLYSMSDVTEGTRISETEISPDGRFMITPYYTTDQNGNVTWLWRMYDVATGRLLSTTNTPIRWMPLTTRYYLTRPAVGGRSLIAVNPVDGKEDVLVPLMPSGNFMITPDEKKLIITTVQEGPKEDKDVYQVLVPDDRQPGWRNRNVLSIYDIASGVLTPITYGHRALRLLDVSDDASHLLLSVHENRLEKRPTTLATILSLDLNTMKTDTIVARDGFIGGGIYSPDGTEILLSGSPESLGGIGNVVPEGRVPSMVDEQLYIRRSNGSIEPLTRDFNPSVTTYKWSRADGQIYFMAENRDCVSLYRMNPKTGKIMQIPGTEELVRGFSLPRTGNMMAYIGQGASNPDRLYTLDTRKLKSKLIDEPMRESLADVKLGQCEGWTFVNSRGDSICGRFYLPPDFDATRKYPMIVNYYGGCSPTSRNFESRYPHHAYAAQDYVVLVLEPSGATGFGQEFSSRHVNTAGKGVAEDIIEGTRRFCEEHQYVDTARIGCIGASYGGFMTQYLQTLTPMFAAAVSHAGISDHSSYWGEGYWGYSYSEVAMANSYPWADPDLFVKQSPLFRADKIHTPLLFVHGDADKNVPPGESIQMFTALKLLGRPTALVQVTGEDHHIMNYSKRLKWQDTIFAWFAKYLKDDSSWWDAMYPEKSL